LRTVGPARATLNRLELSRAEPTRCARITADAGAIEALLGEGPSVDWGSSIDRYDRPHMLPLGIRGWKDATFGWDRD
jgi:hypothetical protein